SFARGVGHNPNTVTLVRRTNGGSWYAMPLRIKPERGQVSENSVKPPSKEHRDVLHDDVEGSKLANKTGVLLPEARLRALNSRAHSCAANVLAGEASTEDIGNNSVIAQSRGGEFSDVIVDRYLRPMFSEHAPTERIDLAERDGLKSARPLQTQTKTAYTGEKVEHLQPCHSVLCGPRLGVEHR